MIYDADKNAVTVVQKAVNAAGYSPALPTDGVYTAAVAAGISWLQTNGGGTVDGHITDELLASLGVDPSLKHFTGVDNANVQKAPPPPPPPPAPTVKPLAVATTTAMGAGIGFAFGGPLGAGIGAVAGIVAGIVIGRA